MIPRDEFERTLQCCGFTNTPDIDGKYDGLIEAIPRANIRDRRELSMFLANIFHESGGLQHKVEQDPQPAAFYDGGLRYIGRGYLQLTHRYNYAAASQYLFGDERLTVNPESVAQSESLCWATAAWFWMRNVPINSYQYLLIPPRLGVFKTFTIMFTNVTVTEFQLGIGHAERNHRSK